MPPIIVRDVQSSIDPDEISKIEIAQSEDSQTSIRIFLKSGAKPQSFLFSDKAAALAFYRKVWAARTAEPAVEDPTGTVATASSPSSA